MYSQKTIIGVFCLCVAGVVGVVAVAFNDKGDQPILKPKESGSVPTRSPGVATAQNSEVIERVSTELAAEGVEPTHLQPESTPKNRVLDPTRLRAAIEESLYGQIDPNVYLEAALALTKLEVGEEMAEPTRSGGKRFPLVGTPEGMSAELWINNPSKDEFSSMRSFVMHFEPPEEHYLVEKAIRTGAKAQVSIWTDRDGRPKYFGFLTEMQVSGETLRQGMTLDYGSVPLGTQYTFDVESPLDVQTHQFGLRDGKWSMWPEMPVAVLGEVPNSADIEALSEGLHNAKL